MRALTLIATLLAAPAFAAVGDFVKPPLILLEAGVFCPTESVGRVEAPDTQMGFIDLVAGDPRVDFHTDIVPAELTMGFGLRLRLTEGTPPVSARAVITHPPFGTPAVSRESYALEIDSLSNSRVGFEFDLPYEMALGPWTMAIEIEGEILLEKSFTVVPAEQSKVRLSMCDGPAVMS